ncbi:hypothetical protein ACFVDT_15865 [Streptomyces sp. NPDC057699]|uniref:hypothetical protein n=1 Tax=Streptomyces sp. NPDC057699 TaxID=3346220 RepID=UPI003685A202
MAGLTSTPMRELLGMYEPDFGHLLDETVHPRRRGGARHPVLRTTRRTRDLLPSRRPLRGPGVTLSSSAAAAAWPANALATYGKVPGAGGIILPGAMSTAL